MPSIFGHAIVGATAAHLSPPVKRQKLFFFLSLLCSIAPDADVVTFALGARYESFFGHRGFFHSIVFSGVFGAFATGLYLKSIVRNPTHKARLSFFPPKISQEWYLFFYFFSVTLAHPLLDAMTDGGHGIALFSPFNIHRYFYTFRPIYVSPLTPSEFLSYVGLRVVLSEVIFLLLPCALIIVINSGLHYFTQSLLKPKRPFPGQSRSLGALTLHRILNGVLKGVLAIVVLASLTLPNTLIREEFLPECHPKPNGVNLHKIDARVLWEKGNGVDNIPTRDLPGKRLLVTYKDLLKNNLLNTPLLPAHPPWSGSFFPSWLGGVSGRWQEPPWTRLWKTLRDPPFLSKSELIALLHASETSPLAKAELEKLAPTEKYDLAVGDYYLTSSRDESTSRGRGLISAFPSTPFWAGYCNSISLAAIYEKEPLQTVTVLNPDGYEIKFYPEDIKALLGISYLYLYPKAWDLGNRCELDSPTSDTCLDINPSALVIALTNLIGLAKTSFLIDKDPFFAVQNSPIRKAEVKVINPPYFTSERPHYFPVETLRVKWLVDVEIKLTLSKISPLGPDSTTFSRSAPTMLEEEDLSYRATLGLDSSMRLVGGRWEDPLHHPDFAWGGGSIYTEPGRTEQQLMGNRSIEWPLIKELVEQSSKPSPQTGPLQVSKFLQSPISHGFAFKSDADGVSGGISYLKWSAPSELVGRLEGEQLNTLESIALVALGTEAHPEIVLAAQPLVLIPGAPRLFFKLQVGEARSSLEEIENLMLRIKKGNGKLLQFQLPFKRKFPRILDPARGSSP